MSIGANFLPAKLTFMFHSGRNGWLPFAAPSLGAACTYALNANTACNFIFDDLGRALFRAIPYRESIEWSNG